MKYIKIKILILILPCMYAHYTLTLVPPQYFLTSCHSPLKILSLLPCSHPSTQINEEIMPSF